MAIAFVQSAHGSASGGSPSATFTANTTPGNFLVATIQLAGVTVPTAPTGWTLAGSKVNGSTCMCVLFYAENITGGTATYSFTTSAHAATLVIAEYSGIATSASFDKTSSGATFGSTVSCSAQTTTQANELWIFAFGSQNSHTISGVTTGYSLVDNATLSGSSGWMYAQIVSATGSAAPRATLNSADNWDAVQGTFIAATGGGGSSWNQSAADTQSAQDSLKNATQKPLTDSHSALATRMQQPQKNLSPDPISALDTWQNQAAKNLPSDWTSGTASNSHQTSKNLPSDWTAAIDGGVRQPNKNLADWSISWDTLLPKAISKALAEGHSGVDAVAKSVLRTLVESFSETDSWTRMKGALLTLSGDAHSATDSFTKQVSKAVGDMASLLDGLTKATNKPLLDSYSTLDTLSKLPSHFLRDWFSQTDTVTESNQHFSGTAWTQNVSDRQSALDTLLGKSITHYSADFFSQLDVMTRSWVAHLTLLEALSGTDAVIKQVGHYVPLDHHSALDFFSRLAGSIITISDAHSARDGLTKSTTVQFLDALSATDSQSKQMLRTLFEAMSQTDQVSAVRTIIQYVMDAFSLTDSHSLQNLPPGGLAHLGLTVALLASTLGLSIALQAAPALLGLLVVLLAAQLSTTVRFA